MTHNVIFKIVEKKNYASNKIFEWQSKLQQCRILSNMYRYIGISNFTIFTLFKYLNVVQCQIIIKFRKHAPQHQKISFFCLKSSSFGIKYSRIYLNCIEMSLKYSCNLIRSIICLKTCNAKLFYDYKH